MRVLALSSSRVGDGAYLSSAVPLIRDFLGSRSFTVAFVPFAAADGDYEGYAAKVREGLASLPLTIHTVMPESGKAVIEQSDVVMVGGGNTFKLLRDLYESDLFALIQQKVVDGTPYIGWSAGANLAGRTICTTNDMPIVQPQSFTAFGFFPFQINPHYYIQFVEGFHGETRDQRLIEFLQVNPGVPVVALPEGRALRLHYGKLDLLGERTAFIFHNTSDDVRVGKLEVPTGTDLTFLMSPIR